MLSKLGLPNSRIAISLFRTIAVVVASLLAGYLSLWVHDQAAGQPLSLSEEKSIRFVLGGVLPFFIFGCCLLWFGVKTRILIKILIEFFFFSGVLTCTSYLIGRYCLEAASMVASDFSIGGLLLPTLALGMITMLGIFVSKSMKLNVLACVSTCLFTGITVFLTHLFSHTAPFGESWPDNGPQHDLGYFDRSLNFEILAEGKTGYGFLLLNNRRGLMTFILADTSEKTAVSLEQWNLDPNDLVDQAHRITGPKKTTLTKSESRAFLERLNDELVWEYDPQRDVSYGPSKWSGDPMWGFFRIRNGKTDFIPYPYPLYSYEGDGDQAEKNREKIASLGFFFLRLSKTKIRKSALI